MNKHSVFFLVLVAALSISVSAERIHPTLHGATGHETVLVQFDQLPQQSHKGLLNAAGCEVERQTKNMNLIVAKCDLSKLDNVAHNPHVSYIWPDEQLQFTQNGSAPQIFADQVWDLGINGTGVNISLIDSGVNSSHPAFEGRFVLEKNFGSGNTTGDACEHGTHTASILASVNETYRGIAHGASLFNFRVDSGGCGVSTSDAIEAIDWSINSSADFIVLNIGSFVPTCAFSTIANYVNATVVEDNIAIITAAGNGGPSNGSIWSPGCADTALTVGSVDDDNNIVSTSSRGPVDDGRQKPDVVAPGNEILSAHSGGEIFTSFSGTSAAMPHVGGVVALMLEQNPDLNWTDIKAIIRNTSIDLGEHVNAQGSGLVNASAAVNASGGGGTPPPADIGFVSYVTSTNQAEPKYRTMDENGDVATEEAADDVGGNPIWLRVAQAPTRDEQLLVTFDANKDVNVQVVTSAGTSDLTELTANAGTTSQRHFDVVYEQSSGDGMIVYADNDAVPAYRIWNGSEFLSAGSLQSDSCTANTRWIRTVADPNSDEIIAMMLDNSGNYCAQVWDGSSWGNTKHFGTDSGKGTQKFDVAYESSGDALAVFETSTAGVLGYCAWDESSWCGSTSTLADRGSQNSWVELASHPTTDRILVGVLQHGNDDVEAIEWNGSAFGTWNQIDNNVEKSSGVNRIMDVAYIGDTGDAMIAWADDNVQVPTYATCSGGNCFSGSWSSSATTTASSNCGAAEDLDYIGLHQDPSSDKVLLYAITQTNHYKCAQLYDGSWQDWQSNLGSGATTAKGEDAHATFT